MGRLGILTLQALDNSDIFLKEEIILSGITDYHEMNCEIIQDEPGFEAGRAWETGHVPKVIPVMVEGDTSTIIAWVQVKPENYVGQFRLNVYIEYEEVEEWEDEEKAREIKDSEDES